jgi:hypothetical protein
MSPRWYKHWRVETPRWCKHWGGVNCHPLENFLVLYLQGVPGAYSSGESQLSSLQ